MKLTPKSNKAATLSYLYLSPGGVWVDGEKACVFYHHVTYKAVAIV